MARRPNFQEGFTLIELLVVITIILILLGMAVEGVRVFAVGVGGDASARRVLKVLEEAHARSLSADEDTNYGVHFESSSITLFQGDTYINGDSGNEITVLRQAEISAVTLSDSTDDVVFARIRGTPSATGTVTIVETRDASIVRTIEIHETGLSEVTP